MRVKQSFPKTRFPNYIQSTITSMNIYRKKRHFTIKNFAEHRKIHSNKFIN